MDSGQPQDEQRCPHAPPEAAEAAALGEAVPSAGAQSRVPPLQSPRSPPGPSSSTRSAPTLGGPGSLLEAPEPGGESWSSEEEQAEVCHPLRPCPGETYMDRELSQGEVSRTSKSSQGEDSSRTPPQENWRRITIRTVWVNPDYPELQRDSLQEEAKTVTPSASDEQVLLAAGTQRPGSPCCSPCSSQTQLAAQTLGELQAVHGQPSRWALQAMCILLWCSCMELPLDD